MMFLKFVSHTDNRTRILEGDDIQYRWVGKDGDVHLVNSGAVYCFRETPEIEFEPNVEFWLFRNGEETQVFMDIGRTAYIMNENGKTIDRIN